jgi:2-oxoglutarate dehydrogenase E2 component (dihydrolipoamide succinyltransferase)
LCEVFTDKLVAKIPSTATGKITEINFSNDDIAPVGHILLKIETGADVEAAAARGSHYAAAKEAP